MTGPIDILHQFGSAQSDLPSDQALLAADGAIDLTLGNFKSSQIITKGSAAAITLAAPTAGLPVNGGHDGLRLHIINTTAFAHTVTNTSPGFNNNGAAQDVGTFAAAKGGCLLLEAYNASWYVVSNISVTLA